MHFDVDTYLPFVMCTVVGSFEGSVQIPSEKYSHFVVSSFMRDSNLLRTLVSSPWQWFCLLTNIIQKL